MVQYAPAPIQVDDLIDDLGKVREIFEQTAPYTPLGGWFRPDQDGDAMSPMWFQKDWVHDDLAVPGSDLFFQNERIIQAAHEFYDADVVVPRSIYVNLMAALSQSGPAHTDNPIFRGRDRTNTPMMLLRTMLWSGLFEHWLVHQATSIWWMNDVEGGGLKYWPDGPDRPPKEHVGGIANTALVGDNHHMFHQVGPVGPFDEGTQLVNALAELAPVNDGSGDWQVAHKGEVHFRAPFEVFRASVLWKADVYNSDEERQRLAKDTLSLDEVVRVFNEDLQKRGEELRVDLEQLSDLAVAHKLSQVYPEPVPVEAGVSFFDSY